MVRKRVATPTSRPTIQVVMLPMMVGRALAARICGSAAYAGAAPARIASVAVATAAIR